MSDEAAQWGNRGLTLVPNDQWSLYALQWASVSAGDLPAAGQYASKMREAGGDNPASLFNAAEVYIMQGDWQAAEDALRQVNPRMSWGQSPRAAALLGWVLTRSGQPEGREGLEALRQSRMQRVEDGSALIQDFGDLAVIADVLGSEDEQLRWWLAAAQQPRGYWYYNLQTSPYVDRIRGRPEFQSWLRETEEKQARQRRELAAVGDWTPDAVVGVGSR